MAMMTVMIDDGDDGWIYSMKILNNVLVADAFAISRIPTQSPPFTKMGEDDPRYAAPPPGRPVQVRHQHHHAEDVAVAVAERVDEADAREKKNIKTASFIDLS